MIRVIQVGLGGMGNAWLNAVLASETVEYAGFVEINAAIAEQQAARYDLERKLIFTTIDDALAAVPADGVIDVTPPQFHHAISLAALDAGVPVLSEKPLAHTLNDARDIVARASATGVLHMVAQNYRYHVPIQTVKRVLDSGEMGAISAVTVEFFKGPHFGGFREEMPYPLIIDMAIHHFDLLRFLLAGDPVTVYGQSWNPPWSWFNGDASASVVLTFSHEVVAAYNGSWCSQARETPWNGHWRIECEQGVITLIDDVVSVQRTTGVDGFNTRHAPPETIAPVAMPQTGQAYLLNEFDRAITQGITPATTCQDNLVSLATVFAVVRSFETGIATPVEA